MCRSHLLHERFQLNWCLHISKHILKSILIISYSSIRLISSSLAIDMSEKETKHIHYFIHVTSAHYSTSGPWTVDAHYSSYGRDHTTAHLGVK